MGLSKERFLRARAIDFTFSAALKKFSSMTLIASFKDEDGAQNANNLVLPNHVIALPRIYGSLKYLGFHLRFGSETNLFPFESWFRS